MLHSFGSRSNTSKSSHSRRQVRHVRPLLEMLEDRRVLSHGYEVEDFQLAIFPQTRSDIFEHSRTSPNIVSYERAGLTNGWGGESAANSYALLESDPLNTNIVTFSGLEVDYGGVLINGIAQTGAAAVQFVGTLATVTYRAPTLAGDYPFLEAPAWLPSSIEFFGQRMNPETGEIIGLPSPGSDEWGWVDTNPAHTGGVEIGRLLEVRLGGERPLFDRLTIHVVPPPPPPPDLFVEDFQLDADPAQPGLASSVFQHSSASPELLDYSGKDLADSTSSPHGLLLTHAAPGDVVTFPGLFVNLASVAVNSALLEAAGDRVAVEFVGSLGTVCYGQPSPSAPPTVVVGELPNPGSVEWVIVDTDPGRTGTIIGQIIEIRLIGIGMLFDDVTIHTLPVNHVPEAIDDEMIVATGKAADIEVLQNDADADGDALSIASVTKPANGTAEVLDDGKTIRYTSNVDFRGTDTFTYVVYDGENHYGQGDTATVTVTVVPGRGIFTENFADDADPSRPGFDTTGVFQHSVTRSPAQPPPTITTAPEGDGYLIVGGGDHKLHLYGTTDQITINKAADEGVIFASVELLPFSRGSVSFIGENGTYTVSFDEEPPPQISVGAGRILPGGLELGSIREIDLFGVGAFDDVRVLIVGAAPNRAPVAVDDVVTTRPGDPIYVYVLDNDTDPDFDFLGIIDAGPAVFGSVENHDGYLRYQPASGFVGRDSFMYTVRDDNGHTSSATVTVTVNTPPEARPDRYELAHDYVGAFGVGVAESVLSNDVDPEGHSLHVDLVTPPAHGRVDLEFDGTFVYYPADPDGRMVSDSFEYRLWDEFSGSTTATVQLVVPLNQVPVAFDELLHLDHDELIVHGNLFNLAVDGDADRLTVRAHSSPRYGRLTVDFGSGEFTYERTTLAQTDGFSFVVTDGYATSNTARIDYKWDNEPPLAMDDFYLVPTGLSAVPGVTSTGRLLKSILDNDVDADGDAVQVELIRHAEHGLVTLSPDGTFTYATTPDAFERDSFTYRLFDGMDASDEVTVTLYQDIGTPILRSDSYTAVFGSGPAGVAALDVTHGRPLPPLANDTFSTGFPVEVAVRAVRVPEIPSWSVELTGVLVSPTYGSGSITIDGHLIVNRVDDPQVARIENDGGFDFFGNHAGVYTFRYYLEYQTFDQTSSLEPPKRSSNATVLILVTATPQRDSDGVEDWIETNAPFRGGLLTGDGNGDHIVDSLQPEVASLPSVVTGDFVTLESAPGTKLFNVAATESPPGLADDLALPLGTFDFTIVGLADGEAATVTMLLPPGVHPTTYYKHGRTQDDPSTTLDETEPHWYEFLYHGIGTTGAELLDFSPADGLTDRIVLHLVDGGLGDDDLLPNGVIRDPGGPGIAIPHLALSGAPSARQSEPYRLTLAATGPGSASVTGWTISWGDGTSSFATGNQAVAEHRYVNAPHTYSVSATANIGSLTFPANNSIDVAVAPARPPHIERIVINDGSSQRSKINRLTVTFSGAVTLASGAFTLTRRQGRSNQAVGLHFTSALINGKTVATITFRGLWTQHGSLKDGNYMLTIRGDRIRDAFGRALDGNRDGRAGGDARTEFFRRFGDTDGDRDVDRVDLMRFWNALGRRAGLSGYLWYLDENNDGVINFRDRLRLSFRWH